MQIDDGQRVLYYFPRHRVGMKENTDKSRSTSSKRAIAPSTMDEVQAMIDNVCWKIDVTPKEPNACTSCY